MTGDAAVPAAGHKQGPTTALAAVDDVAVVVLACAHAATWCSSSSARRCFVVLLPLLKPLPLPLPGVWSSMSHMAGDVGAPPMLPAAWSTQSRHDSSDDVV